MLSMITSVVVLAAVGAVGYLVNRAFKLTGKRDELVLLAMYIGVPIVILMLISLVKGMYVERYLVDVVIGLLMLVGVSLGIVVTDKNKRLRPASIALSSVVFVSLGFGVLQLLTVGNYNFQRLETPTVKQLASSLADCATSPVVAEGPYTAIELDYYIGDSCDIYFVSEMAELGGGYAPLSESALRVKHLDDVSFTEFTYVTYNKDDATTSRFTNTSETTFGKLSKLRFSAE